jgi:hypothetical protein
MDCVYIFAVKLIGQLLGALTVVGIWIGVKELFDYKRNRN